MMANMPPLTPEDSKLLETARADNARSGRPFTPSAALWRACINEHMSKITSEGLGIIEAQRVNERFSSRLDPDHRCYHEYSEHMLNMGSNMGPSNLKTYYAVACWMLYQHVKANDDLQILQRSSSTSANTCVIDGVSVSWDYLMSVASVQTMARYVPGLLTDPLVVLDLGPGWGRIGHVLLQVNPKLTYVALDLPESMMCVRHRLKQLFPNTNVLDYGYVAQQESLDHEMLTKVPSLVFGGSHHLPKFAPDSIDLVISINSMQEMDPGDQEMYLNLFEARAKNAYIMAHECKINGQAKPLSQYVWPGSWERTHLVPAGKLFFYRDFFEVMFKRHE